MAVLGSEGDEVIMGHWFIRKTQTEKATKFGIIGSGATRSIYVAPRPTRHLPTECRAGWLCNDRGRERVRLGRKHLLARPPKGSRQLSQSVIAQILPNVRVSDGTSPATVFEQATNNATIGANELVVGMSDVRRVHIEDTGVVVLERTRCTQSAGGERIVTLFWAIYDLPEKTLRMARICAKGEAELRTYRAQVADFLRRWTASSSISTEQKSILIR